MRYHTIVLPLTSIQLGDAISLGQAHRHHLEVVLRKKPGDRIILASPAGYFIAELITKDGGIAASVVEMQDRATHSPLPIHLYQGICQPKKMDWIIQKTTELGVEAITPIHTERCQYTIDSVSNKMARLGTIAENACEQAQRNIVPTIHPPCALSRIDTSPESCNLLLVPDATDTLASIDNKASHINLIIGPEGGLTPAEITYLTNKNWRPIRFGPRVLRTETAAIAITAAIAALWGDCK